MTKARVRTGLVAGCLLLWGGAVTVWAAPPAASQILMFRPKQEGVLIGTPTAQEEAACKVELVKAVKGSGWMLRDPRGLPLRKFMDTNGDNKIDVWSYYKDGVEVYREIDTNYNGRPDQYRWLGVNGTKWGADDNEDGKIDAWKAISAEEVSQEIVQALASNDFARLQVLMITEAEIKALELPADQAGRIREMQKQAPARFQATAAKAGFNDKTRWVHLETSVPQCLLGEAAGMKNDVIRYKQATIVCETAGKNEWLQTGELIQVGAAWRIVDAPTVGISDGLPGGTDGQTTVSDDPELKKLLEELNVIDKGAPKGSEVATEVVRYNLQRADLIERIVAKVKPEDREQWIRQIADCLSAAAQSSPAADTIASKRLESLETQIVASMPGSGLAAYITFRELSAWYARQLNEKPKDFDKVQEQWVERLSKFVQTFPKADDAAEALMQLGMVNEFLGKDTPAKNWYEQLITNFPDSPQAAKAKGARSRLAADGKAFELSGPTLSGFQWDISKSAGKVVVVYYWASWNQQCVGDFAKLKLLLDGLNSQAVELVCVNLDNTAEEANAFLKRSPAPGTQLFQPGGLDSPLATQYGVMVLPNMFLVGKDGKVVSHTIQIGNLEEEVKKLLK